MERGQLWQNKFSLAAPGSKYLVQDYAYHGVSVDANEMLSVTLDFIKMALQHTMICKDHANNNDIASKAAEQGTLTFKVDFQSWTGDLEIT